MQERGSRMLWPRRRGGEGRSKFSKFSGQRKLFYNFFFFKVLDL